MPNKSPSLATRALLAVLLTIGFYGLALVIVGALLFFIYWEFEYAHRINVRSTLIALVAAVTILWSIVPRPDRFELPGPRLSPDRHPKLFEHIRAVAQKANQKMPTEVYLIPDVNAFVAERGGVMGIGSRRVMGIGLALLQAMNVSQFRYVIAHEFGHYYGGDTKLAPWVYKTRQAIIRTVQSLGSRSWLYFIFKWYGTMFLRLTHSISRQQEYAADRMSAQIIGVQPAVEALSRMRPFSSAFDGFWQSEFVPVLRAGYRAPLAQGFAQFLNAKPVTEWMSQVAEEEAKSKTDIYDTHPTPHERIAALQALPKKIGEFDDTPAITLLDNLPEVEKALLEFLMGQEAHQLEPLAWENVGARVYLPGWRKSIECFASVLKGTSWSALPEFLHSPNALTEQIQQSAERELTRDELNRVIVNVVGRSLALELAQSGWMLESELGKEFVLRRNDLAIQPFTVVKDLLFGKMSADDWRKQCNKMGIPESAQVVASPMIESGGVIEEKPPIRRGYQLERFYLSQVNWLGRQRVFQVFVTDQSLCAARVGEQLSFGRNRPVSVEKYEAMDPSSPEFLQADKLNWRINRAEVQRLVVNRKTHSGTFSRNSGKVEIYLANRVVKSFALSGIQNVGEVIEILRRWFPNVQVIEDPAFKVEKQSGELRIYRKWLRGATIIPVVLIAVFFVAIVGIMVWAAVGSGQSADTSGILVELFLVCVAGGMIYYVLAQLVNTTFIKVDAREFEVKHKPLPFPGSKRYVSSEITQLYCKERQVISDNRYVTMQRTVYDVYAVLRNGKHEKILSGLDNPQHALRVEKEVKQYLKIQDEPAH